MPLWLSAFPVLFQMEIVLATASCSRLHAGLLSVLEQLIFSRNSYAAVVCEGIFIYPSLVSQEWSED